MKPLITLLPFLAALVYGQSEAKMTADKVMKDDQVSRAIGHVQVQSGPYRLQSDQGTLHADTQEVDMLGHARITIPGRSDRIFIRYNAGVLASPEEVVIAADHINLKNGLLRGIGHVSAQIDGKQLQADDIEMFLNIGDGRVRGSIRINGVFMPPGSMRTLRPLDQRYRFPPDIVK